MSSGLDITMIPILKRLFEEQRGSGTLTLALIGLMLSSMLIIPFLTNLQTHSISVQKNASSVNSLSSGTGAVEHALWLLQHEENFNDSLTYLIPSITYDVTINDETVPVTITRIFPEGYTPPTPPETPQKAVSITKTVTPATVSGSEETTFSYTIIFKNFGYDRFHIKQINDQLPPGLSYISGTFGGIATGDPAITTNNGQEFLQFTDNGDELVENLGSGETVTLTFDAVGTLRNGAHYNHANARLASAEKGSDGLRCRATGATAPITVSNAALPVSPPAPSGISMEVTMSVTPGEIEAFSTDPLTYTVTIENTGTDTLQMKEVYATLPPHFTYVVGSTTGLLGGEPDIADDVDHRDRLKWKSSDFALDKHLHPGEINTFTFQALSNVIEGAYKSEV